jgi:hypothetical protein
MGISEQDLTKYLENVKRAKGRAPTRGEPPRPGKPRLARSKPADRTLDGMTFDSRAELTRYRELQALKLTGEVRYFLRQPRFDLLGATYRADFQIFWTDGRVTYEDVKGSGSPRFVVDRFKRSARQVAVLYGVEVEVVRR